MCYQFFTYYPRSVRLNYCVSSPSHRSIANFMIKFNKYLKIRIISTKDIFKTELI